MRLPSLRPAHHLTVTLLAAGALCACGGHGPTAPDNLPAQPVLVSPVGGTQVSTDTPTLTVQNARGFDQGEASYTFEVTSASGVRPLLSITVAAGQGTTVASLTSPLPRGMVLAWRVRARSTSGEVTAGPATFRLPAVSCQASSNPFAQAVIDLNLPFCERMPNIYNDPSTVLGPPDVAGFGPDAWTGFLSLGDGGQVTVDMESCAADQSGMDVRVYQAVGSEPVTLYAGGTPSGPWVLVESRKICGTRVPGAGAAMRYCDFDLVSGEVQEARYFKVEDGELYPCADAGTPSEGADIDAVEILHRKP